jgi:hypothetical protein
MSEQRFEATLERPDTPGSWTYLDIPFDVEEVFGRKGQVKVKGTINGYPYRSSTMPKGDGSHFLVVNKTIRDKINVTQGNSVQIVMDLDTDPRTVEVPDDFQQALDMHSEAKAIFEKFSYSRQNEYVTWIESAKADKTRKNRIQSAVERLARGLGLKENAHQ